MKTSTVQFKGFRLNMAEMKPANKSKSKSSNSNNSTNKSKAKLSSQPQPQVASNSISAINVPKPIPKSGVPGSVLDKLELGDLKDTALKNMKKGIKGAPFPLSREACIEYVLDLIISNVIQNGRLKPKKADKLRSTIMKNQISAICDDMISAKTKICRASHSRLFRRNKSMEAPKIRAKVDSRSRSLSRSKSKMQNRTGMRNSDHSPLAMHGQHVVSKFSSFHAKEKVSSSLKEKETGGVNRKNSSTVVAKKKKRSEPRNKSLDSSSSVDRIKKTSNVQISQPSKVQNYRQHASSEVPSSNHSMENNLQFLNTLNIMESISNMVKVAPKVAPVQVTVNKQADVNKNTIHGNAAAKTPSSVILNIKNNAAQKNKQGGSNKTIVATSSTSVKSSASYKNKQVDCSKNISDTTATSSNTSSDKTKPVERNKTVIAPSSTVIKSNPEKTESTKDKNANPTTIEETTTLPASQSEKVTTMAAPVTVALNPVGSTSNIRSLNTVIINSSSVPSTASTGYQILVDMKGFQNDEISMEVEGRQLIFLASRPRRDDVNVRKVTEIVDVPAKVNMENLKIGRRMDGYVIVEEY